MNKLLQNVLTIMKINSLNERYGDVDHIENFVGNILIKNNINPLFLIINIFPSYYNSKGVSSIVDISYETRKYVRQRIKDISLVYTQVLKLVKVEGLKASYLLEILDDDMKKRLIIESKDLNVVLSCIKDVGNKLTLEELQKILEVILPKNKKTQEYNFYNMFYKLAFSLEDDNDVVNKGKFLLTKMKEVLRGQTYSIRGNIIKRICTKYIKNKEKPEKFIQLMKGEKSINVWECFIEILQDKLIEKTDYFIVDDYTYGVVFNGCLNYTKNIQKSIKTHLKGHSEIYSPFLSYEIIDEKTYNKLKERSQK